jgi:hypothetical protein
MTIYGDFLTYCAIIQSLAPDLRKKVDETRNARLARERELQKQPTLSQVR